MHIQDDGGQPIDIRSSTGPRLGEIRFYSTKEAFGCFSNFSDHSIILDNVEWRTTEHYFQAQKFVGTDDAWSHAIQDALTAKEAAAMGRDRSHSLRSDWDKIKDDVMRVAVMTKALAHAEVSDALFATRGMAIIEDTSNDYYWGCGSEGTGKNMLGVILEEVREVLLKVVEGEESAAIRYISKAKSTFHIN